MANSERVCREKLALSTIIVSRGDECTLEPAIQAVVDQKTTEPFDVIVVTSGSKRSVEMVREKFPSVTLVALEQPALPGRARNAGVRVARGAYVSFPGSHVKLVPGSLEARIQTHKKGYAMVTGALLNGTPTAAGWASYFMDHSESLPGCPSRELARAPAHCSYDRKVLLNSGLFPEDMRAGEDTVVNERLWKQGHRAYRNRAVVLYHRSPCTTPLRLVRHHFVRGRAWGRILAAQGTGFGVLSGYVSARMQRTSDNVEAWGGELAAHFARVKPLVWLGIVSAWLGVGYELAHRKRERRAIG
jgi:glycosyltransferase involved in cell wall biosynthesis